MTEPSAKPVPPWQARVLVTADVEETRDGIERLLSADGYRVDQARTEDEAVQKALHHPPDLILAALGGRAVDAIACGARIRRRAALGEQVPVVVFSVAIVEEGAEVAVGPEVYATRPENFDQLRRFLARLLRRSRWTH